jgi:hypothetical protein
MELPALHTHITCPRDGGVAILLVDVETERLPYFDEDGNPLYHCLKGRHLLTGHRMIDRGDGRLNHYSTHPSVLCPSDLLCGRAYSVLDNLIKLN